MDAISAVALLAPKARFNPRARDGRDEFDHLISGSKVVSIHAPVMDAILAVLSIVSVFSFNPRARDGRD